MENQTEDNLINMIQSSTRGLLASFRDKVELLSQCSEDLKQIIHEGYDVKISKATAKKLFGENHNAVSFLAIDGTQSQDQELDMLVFYAGTFGYTGQLNFTEDKGCCYDEPSEIKASMNISAAIPVHEEDASSIVGKLTEGGIEVDTERLPSALMQLAEYYMAVKTLYANPEIKVLLLDRMPSIDAPHLIGNAIELLESNTSILLDMNTPFGKISSLDLELARMLHPNDVLQVPFPRSQLIKYAAINQLIKESDNNIDDVSASTKKVTYKDLLDKIGAQKGRLNKLVNDFTKFNERYSLFSDSKKDEDDRHSKDFNAALSISLKPIVKTYWDRVFSASIKLAEHIFDTPSGEHPLLYEKRPGTKVWITSDDLDYLTLIMIYALLRLAWEKNVLVIGLVKDIAAAEMIKTVIPILQTIGKIKLDRELPRFNSDKMLLQTACV